VEANVPGHDDLADAPYYVMPWAERTLASAKDLRGNVQRVLEIGARIADALAVAHENGIIHRDVKPANVLLDDEGMPVLADFGICYVQTDDQDRRLTRTLGETVGSDDYVAPELRGGRLDEVDGRVDIYSLGKTLYSALAGGSVFPLERWDDSRYDLRGAGSTPVLDHFYGLLPVMVATDRENRYRSMEECRAQLDRAATAVRSGTPYTEGIYSTQAAGAAVPATLGSEVELPHPLSAPAAVAALKRYLTRDGDLVTVHDLVLGEAHFVRSGAMNDKLRLEQTDPTEDAIRAHVSALENRAAALIALMATGCHWGRGAHERIWPKALGRAADLRDAVLSERTQSGRTDNWAWNNLRYYPATLALYAGGIASMAAGHWRILVALLMQPIRRFDPQPAIIELNSQAIMDAAVQREALGNVNVLTPLSERIFRVLRTPLRDLFADEAAYEPMFDQFEYLIAMVVADVRLQADPATRAQRCR
jgi:hypothetical protein